MEQTTTLSSALRRGSPILARLDEMQARRFLCALLCASSNSHPEGTGLQRAFGTTWGVTTNLAAEVLGEEGFIVHPYTDEAGGPALRWHLNTGVSNPAHTLFVERWQGYAGA